MHSYLILAASIESHSLSPLPFPPSLSVCLSVCLCIRIWLSLSLCLCLCLCLCLYLSRLICSRFVSSRLVSHSLSLYFRILTFASSSILSLLHPTGAPPSLRSQSRSPPAFFLLSSVPSPDLLFAAGRAPREARRVSEAVQPGLPAAAAHPPGRVLSARKGRIERVRD